MYLILLIAASYSLSAKQDDEPTVEPTRTPYATLVSTKPTLAIALSTCIACIVFMIIATSIKCLLKSPDEQADGTQEQLLVTRDNFLK